MSFILDALKKSERERQRQTGPALFEVKVAPPRNRFPMWAVVIGVLLVVNIGVVIWLLLRNPSKANESPEVLAANPPSVAAPVQAPPPQVTMPAPPPAEPSSNVFPMARNSEAPSLRENAPEPNVLNPDDYEPAREAPRRAASPPPQAAPPEEEAPATSEEPPPAQSGPKLPTYQDAVAQGLGVPEMHLDLHVYDPEPDKGFVLVNMQKLKAGDSFGPGVRVDRITPDGAVMTYRGVSFLLRQD
jgi:general secretion pathway protein B